MVIKRLFFVLLAVNALLVLFVIMKRDFKNEVDQVPVFSQQGDSIQVVMPQHSVVNKEDGGCGEVGPLETSELSQQVMRRLSARGMNGYVSERDVVVSTDFWVIIPPRASEKQAFRLLRQLQLANIDSYIVTQGDYANAISLGLFTVKSSAYGVKDRMIDSGFEAVVQEIQRSQKQFWVVFSGDLALVRESLSDLSVNVLNKSCKSR